MNGNKTHFEVLLLHKFCLGMKTFTVLRKAFRRLNRCLVNGNKKSGAIQHGLNVVNLFSSLSGLISS